MYNCVGSTILGLYVVVFLGASIGDSTGQKEWMSIGLGPEWETVVSPSNSNYVRGRVEM